MGGSEGLDPFGTVAGDLGEIERRLHESIASDPPEVAEPMADLFAAGGKRVRPGLVLMAGGCGRYDLDRLAPAAMAVELAHAATLVHDDVIDRAPLRRGRPTVAASRGDEPAIVIGDYYFAKAYREAARCSDPEVTAILAGAVMEICAGEVRQQAIRHRYSTGVDEYMSRIDAKTAALMAAACEIGARLGGLDATDVERLRLYGRALGIAFQIADDVLDYTASEGEVGKPIAHDVEEGFATLPLMLAREDPTAGAELSRILEDGRVLDGATAARVVELVLLGDGPARSLEVARSFAERARASLEGLAASPMLSNLESLCDYVVSRKL